jgi:nucleoside-diphosphate-sugar epimerase
MKEQQTILITGGTGFLGAALCNKLAEIGHTVVAFDNFSRNYNDKSLDKRIIQCEGDVRDIDSLDIVCKKYKFDTLWHLAAVNGTKNFYERPEVVLEVGVKGAINTIDVALKYKIDNYFLVSSSEIYNTPTQIPTLETERMLIPDSYNPRFSYAGSKIISELLAIHYADRNGLIVKIFRPHNIFGRMMGQEHAIPELVKKIVKGIKNSEGQVVIDIQGEGTETRSFCYIDDAIKEMIFASNLEDKTCETYNIGVEEEISIIELIKMISEILEVKVAYRKDELKEGGTIRRCPSIKKLTNRGYVSRHSLFHGLEKTVLWYRDYYMEQANETK